MDTIKELLIDQIIADEWEMFQRTQNEGGQASCQRDPEQFDVMRRSQFESWNEECLQCYYGDLENARLSGGNLLTLKYAYMMESTNPEGYQAIADTLPEISEERMELVNYLTEQTVKWCEEFAEEYPNLSGCGRPIYRTMDTPWDTSVETYSRGEFMTYGKETLEALREYFQMLIAEGRNLHREVIEKEFSQYGFDSLAQVEERIGKKK